MIKTTHVEIKLNSKTIKWYWNLGYSGTTNEIIKVDVSHLKPTSHYKVNCSCDICGKEKELPYKSYIFFTKRDGIYYCHKCSMLKKMNSNLEKYGYKHTLQISKIREKIKETCQSKYGAVCYLSTTDYLNNQEIKKKIREKNLKSGKWIGDEELTEFLRYKRRCRRLTDAVRKQLFNEWDGYDFYDGDYIRDNTNLHFTHRFYPTVDHKISIIFGFRNNISEEEISSINNLCVTKRFINNSKREKCYYEKI